VSASAVVEVDFVRYLSNQAMIAAALAAD